MDYILLKGSDSKQILENGWRQPYFIPLLVVALAMILIYVDGSGVVPLLNDPWTLFYIAFVISAIYIGYYYPVPRLTWMFVILAVFMMMLSAVSRIH